jgi:hypothetical protein
LRKGRDPPSRYSVKARSKRAEEHLVKQTKKDGERTYYRWVGGLLERGQQDPEGLFGKLQDNELG